MWNAARGFMAIWSDVAPVDLAFYHDWLLKEHFPERVGIPGFINARVFGRDVGDHRQFFILYETQSPDVLASAAYVERLNNPTEKSRAIMPRLKNFVRGAGRVIESQGVCAGGVARVFRFENKPSRLNDSSIRRDLFRSINDMDSVLAVHLFEVDASATTIQTNEKKMRTSKEGFYEQLLVIEAAAPEALRCVSDVLNGEGLGQREQSPFDQTYRLVAELQCRSLEG